MNLDHQLRSSIQHSIQELFHQSVEQVQMQPTNAEFEGTHTLVCFPLTKLSKRGPEETARMIGEHLQTHSGIITRFNVVKGFLNLVISDAVWIQILQSVYSQPSYGKMPPSGKEIMVEYSSPNTNKPLHLGHLRNNFLGYAVAGIFEALGYRVHKVQIINDRGIHICKSMAAWQQFGNGETPHSQGVKGDKLVGKYYVEFDKQFKSEIAALEASGMPKEAQDAAVRRAADCCGDEPTAAAVNPLEAGLDERIRDRARGIEVERVEAPLPDIAMHVMQSPGIRGIAGHGQSAARSAR